MKNFIKKIVLSSGALAVMLLPMSTAFADDVPSMFYDGDETNRVFTSMNNVEELSNLQSTYQDGIDWEHNGLSRWIDSASASAELLDKVAVILAEDKNPTKTQETVAAGYLQAIDNKNDVIKKRLFDKALQASEDGRFDDMLKLGEALSYSQDLEKAIETYEDSLKDGDYNALGKVYLTKHIYELTRAIESL